MSKTEEEIRFVPVGKFVRPHGVRGAVKIYPYGETLAAQKAGEKVFLRSSGGETPDGLYSELTVSSLKAQGKFLLARFEELNGVEEASGVAGMEVFIPEERLPPTSEGEYYLYRLIGLNVETREGRHVGVFREVIETGGADVWVIDGERGETLVPATEEFICEVDSERGVIVIDPPEGLIE